jgi:hypothetical protein
MVEVSADRRRAILTSTSVDMATPGIPTYYAEDVATSQALERPDFSYFLGDDGGWAGESPEQEDGEQDGITLAPPATEEASGDLPGRKNFERWDNAVCGGVRDIR